MALFDVETTDNVSEIEADGFWTDEGMVIFVKDDREVAVFNRNHFISAVMVEDANKAQDSAPKVA